MNTESVSVLIVGAGGAGLSLALLLRQQGIHPLLIERRDDVSWYPRARNLNFRTLEVFRGLGLADEIHAAGNRVSRVFARQWLASAQEMLLMDPETLLDSKPFSPEPFAWYCPQSRLEPILRAVACDRGVDVRYATELIGFTQDDSEVSATLRRRSTGESYVVRANFLVGADGAHSRIRESLGISTQGKGTLAERFVFIYFRAAWDHLIRGHQGDAFLIENPDVRGFFLVAEKNLGMFILMQEEGEELTRERSLDLVQKAIGQKALAVEIVEVAPWQPEQRVAERFQQGRALLVGDAAHAMPPKEGLGVNTAIQSAQNLAWKMAAVLGGRAGPELLLTYQAERRPVAWYAAKHSMTGPAAALIDKTSSEEKASEFFPIVGYRYRSQAIISEDNSEPRQTEIVLLDREELTGVPGTRVPHLWLERQSMRISTLDLFDGGFVLLTGSQGIAWCQAANRVSASLRIGLTAYRIGPDGDLPHADLIDPENQWALKMGVRPDGAVLIRPDSFIAWRSNSSSAAPDQSLQQVLNRVLCRSASATIA
jgi:putative polyketide hydroxylase